MNTRQSKNNRKKYDCLLRISAYNIFNKNEMEAIDMRETRIVEFKETITNTFLKTVSAFSNYDGGTILLV